jgi:predicted nuclease with RNAse H fold
VSITLGVDVASQPQGTAACTIAWNAVTASIEWIEAGIGDERLIELLSSTDPERIALDVPLGWPSAFAEALARHYRREPWGEVADPPKGKSLTHRLTDRWIHDQVGLWPLSVSTDRIAYPAMRIARLLGQLKEADRSGGGRIVEVYPAAALKRWGLDARLYKRVNGRPKLARLLEKLREKAPWLQGDESTWDSVQGDDNQFDALICALIARAVARHQCEEIPAEHREIARIEGWIHLPVEGSLNRLLA